MPLLRQKYQPYFPDPDAPAHEDCEGTYCHPIQLGDIIKSQFTQTPCGNNEIGDPYFDDISFGAELLADGDFPNPSPAWVDDPAGSWDITAPGAAIYQATFPTNTYTQSGLVIVAGSIYRLILSTAGLQGGDYLNVYLGSTTVSLVIDTNATSQEYFIECGADNTDLVFEAVSANNFAIGNASLKLVTYNGWDTNSSWVISDGVACHVEGTTGLLEEAVANYIVANEYYEIGVTVTGYIAGTCDVYVADVLAGTLSANGTVYFYATPTVTGVVSFDPSSDFIGCLDFEPIPNTELQPGLYELKNNHLAYIVDPDGNEYQIGEYFQYYERWVTLIFDISDLELGYDCYTLKVIDACIVQGIEMVTNGGFADNGASWSGAGAQLNYNTPSGTLQLVFNPIEGTDYIDNGDFATGDFTDWTAGANWAVVGNKARHTIGSTATLVQAVTVPTRVAAPTPNFWWVQFTISNRTTGSISVTLEDSTKTGYLANDTLTIFLTPTTGGAVDFTITPTSDFDGDIDDISIHYTNATWSSQPASNNVVNPLMIAGNYEASIEITATSDPLIGVAVRILGQTQSINYFTTVGVHTVSLPNYVPGAQIVQVIARFEGQDGTDYGIPGTINVDNISVYPIEPFEATYTSECLNYQEEFTDTKMVVAYCDQISFGFEFENTGFTFQQRMECRTLNSSYPQELQIQKSGMGNARITYASLEKYWIFATGFMSETAHDTLAVMRLCDHFLIGPAEDNGTEYITGIDEYAPEWRGEGDYNLATSAFQIRIKEGGMKFNRHL